MDSITQAALGAAIGQAMIGKKTGKKGAMIGAIIATIPDLDIVLLPFYDSVQRISIHRGFSHSILFSLIGALLFTFILSRIKWTKQISILRLLLFCWLALITHMLLDAFTVYGTQLYLPFSDKRISFDSVNIVDPFYTLPLLIGLFYTIYQHRKNNIWSKANNIGLIVSSIYLLFTLGNKQYVTKAVKSNLQVQNIEYNSIKTIPVGVGNLNWYGVAKNDTSIFLGKYCRLNSEPIEFHSFPINEQLLDGINKELAEKLKWFSQDFFTVAEDQGRIRLYNLQCDMQGVRIYGNYKAPTAFYFEIKPNSDGTFKLNTGMHSNATNK
jgi:inner membrane protein